MRLNIENSFNVVCHWSLDTKTECNWIVFRENLTKEQLAVFLMFWVETGSAIGSLSIHVFCFQLCRSVGAPGAVEWCRMVSC